MGITISDTIFNRILKVIGYPIISFDDLTDGKMTKTDIENFLIYPAMQEYYKWFPLKNNVEYEMNGVYEIPFPTEFVFGVSDSKFLNTPTGTGLKTLSPIVNGINITVTDNTYANSYGSAYDYNGLSRANVDRQTVAYANQSESETFKVVVDERDRVVRGFTNYTGRVLIVWSEYSNDWNDIPFQREQEVIHLAQANVLDFFGDIKNQIAETGTSASISGADFLDKAESLREAVMEGWKNKTKVVINRG